MNHSLHDIALACDNGACNPKGLLRSLGLAIQDMPASWSPKDDTDLKYIVGHISFLLGESLGPSEKTVQELQR
jgi:hypothetical protein